VICGFSSFFDQIRCTVLCDMPTRRPMLRTLQRLQPFGGRVTSPTTRATFASDMEGRRPRPGLSSRPARPWFSKRFDQVETRFAVVPSSSATVSTLTPFMRSRMIDARSCSRTVLVAALALRCSSLTTCASACKRLIGRAIRQIPSQITLRADTRRYLRDRTLGRVDGFDQDESECESHEGAVVLRGFLAS
jgi:hypothetical protein